MPADTVRTVSVIAPCRNERGHVDAFCEAVAAQRLPDGVALEVLVADGCSVLDNLYLGSDTLFGSSLNREEKIERAGRTAQDRAEGLLAEATDAFPGPAHFDAAPHVVELR